MKTFSRAALTVTIFSLACSIASAQGMNVALLDVGYIFKNHQGFKQQMDSMKAQVQTFEQKLKTQQEQIQTKSRQLSTYKPGTPQYKQLEETTTKELADLKVQMQLKRKEIMEQEAKIYMATYRQVMSAVAAFANAKNIDLVLRYDRESAPNDTASPQETLKIINRPVIFEKGLDISDAVLGQVNALARTRGPAAR